MKLIREISISKDDNILHYYDSECKAELCISLGKGYKKVYQILGHDYALLNISIVDESTLNICHTKNEKLFNLKNKKVTLNDLINSILLLDKVNKYIETPYGKHVETPLGLIPVIERIKK